jgi:hypothetical protein
MRVETLVTLDGVNVRARGQQGLGERTQTRTDFDHGVAGSNAGEGQGFVDDVAVDEEVLTECAFRMMAETDE